MEHLDKATAAATWFDQFVQHGSAISVLLSLIFGWGLALFLSFPIHRYVKDNELATFWARTACVLGSFAVTAGTWPNEYRWAWAGAMGVLSPLLGFVALWRLKSWAPNLYEFLAMKKSTPTEGPK